MDASVQLSALNDSKQMKRGEYDKRRKISKPPLYESVP